MARLMPQIANVGLDSPPLHRASYISHTHCVPPLSVSALVRERHVLMCHLVLSASCTLSNDCSTANLSVSLPTEQKNTSLTAHGRLVTFTCQLWMFSTLSIRGWRGFKSCTDSRCGRISHGSSMFQYGTITAYTVRPTQSVVIFTDTRLKRQCNIVIKI